MNCEGIVVNIIKSVSASSPLARLLFLKDFTFCIFLSDNS